MLTGRRLAYAGGIAAATAAGAAGDAALRQPRQARLRRHRVLSGVRSAIGAVAETDGETAGGPR